MLIYPFPGVSNYDLTYFAEFNLRPICWIEFATFYSLVCIRLGQMLAQAVLSGLPEMSENTIRDQFRFYFEQRQDPFQFCLVLVINVSEQKMDI